MGERVFGGALVAALLIALLIIFASATLPNAQSSVGTSCADFGVSSCFAAGNLTNGGIGYGGCAITPGTEFVPSVGKCMFINSSYAATFYTSYAGNGTIIRSPISGQVPNPIPVISDVIQTNNKYSPYLITCPVSPNPTNSTEYLSAPGSYIAGNRCLASVLPLLTSVTLSTTDTVTGTGYFFDLAGWTTGSAPASASSSYSISNMAKGNLQNLAFSGDASVAGSPYNLSSSYNTKSYIFQGVNSTPQQGLWTWTAEYANLSKINLKYLNLDYNSKNDAAVSSLDAEYIGLELATIDISGIPIPIIAPVGCSFSYNFAIHSYVAQLANANVPVPIYNITATSKDYLEIGGYIYSPVRAISAGGNKCYNQMLAGGPGCQIAVPSSFLSSVTSIFGGSMSVTNWLKIGTNATAHYQGKTYTNLPLYLNASNTLDINRLQAYYGVVVGCEPWFAWEDQQGLSEAFDTGDTYCGPVMFLPQAVAQNSTGSPDPSTAIQYMVAQLGMSGSALQSLVLSPKACGGYNSANSIQNKFTGHYSLADAQTQNKAPLQYCVASKGGGFTDSFGQQMCRGAGMDAYSCSLYVGISTNPLSGNALNLTYAVPINSGGTSVLLTTNSSVGVDFKNMSIFPYITYGASIPSTFSQFTPASFLNLSYALYSPNNYASATNAFGVPTTPLEPFNIFSGSGLLANYSTPTRKSELADFPSSIASASSNTFYDEFPVVEGGSTIQTKVQQPIAGTLTLTSNPSYPGTAFSTAFTDNSIDPTLGSASLLNSRYPANTILYVSSTIDSQGGLPACSDNWIGGACIGDTEYTASVALGSNIFVFGNMTLDYGITIQTNGYAIITNGIINDPAAIISGYKTGSVTLTNHGTVGFTNITNPAFISESPNGYIYVINYTSGCGFFCISTSTQSYIFKMKYIPSGYYNYSVYQPSQLAKQTKLGKWINQTKNYFRGSLLAQTPSLYILGASQFTSTSTPNWCLFSLCIGSVSSVGSSPAPFLPLAAEADYQGDLFLVGAPIKSVYGKGNFALAEITAGGSVTVDNTISQPAGFVPSQEFAVSPGGEYVYLANVSYPRINIYSTEGGDFQYVGGVPLTYSNSSYNMNVMAYLAHGGPFNSKVIQGGYQSSSPVATMNDIPSFHHPIAISDVDGTLFVLDNWTFGISSSGPLGSVWMLRAFSDNGIEIPVEYSSNNTMASASSAPQAASPLSAVQSGVAYWPPYGWPLTANITLPSGVDWTICEHSGGGACSRTGNVTGFNSIGPQISLYGTLAGFTETTGSTTGGFGTLAPTNPTLQYNGNKQQLGISSDFNGDMYLIIHDSIASQPYTQLLMVRPNIDNYTKVNVGAGPQFQCYSNVTGFPDCTTANFISGLYPPLLVMPDSFEFLSGQGSALQYFSVASALSALLPTGTTSPANSVFMSGATGGPDYGILATQGLTGSSLGPSGLLRTYINSTLNGYVINPYHIEYKLQQTWKFQDGTKEWDLSSAGVSYLEADECSYNPDSQSKDTNVFTNQVTKLSPSSLNQSIEGGGIYAEYNLSQGDYQPNLSDQNLILPPYLAYSLFSNRLFGEIYVNQTITPSMAGSMSSQLEGFVLSNLGTLGSIIGGFTNTAPKVVNASRNYNYTEDVYVQTIFNPLAQGFGNISTGSGSGMASFSGLLSTCGGFCAPAYEVENAILTGPTPNNTILGADCGGHGCPGLTAGPVNLGQLASLFGSGFNPTAGLPPQVGALTGLSGYYYGPNYLNGNSILNYSETNQTNYFQLFSLFKRVSYLYNLGLNLSSIPQVYGYNRLIYTYVDRFNNTVYMPVDVDFANITEMTLSATPAVNVTNVNQTRINITGTLEYLRPDGSLVPAPRGSSVYLYYGTNINYNNASALLSGLPALGSSYYKWAENCAFSPQSYGCSLANPLSTYGLASSLITNLLGQTNQVTYKPNFNASGQCAPQPKSLLSSSQDNCNIYGNLLGVSAPGVPGVPGLPSLLPAVATGPDGNQQYCVPEYTNGTGTLTSQLGLIAVATTNSTGGFSKAITACGVGTGKVIAQYYGYPPPEPISVAQTELADSVVPISPNLANDIVSPEYNYYYSPNSTVSTFQIGSYQLSLGNLYAWVPIIIILVLLMASKSSLGQSGGIFELFGFATLYDTAAGIGLGGGGRGKGLRKGYQSTAQRYRNPFIDAYQRDLRNARKLSAAKLVPPEPPTETGLVPRAAPPPPGAPGRSSSTMGAGKALGAGFTRMAVTQGRNLTRRERAAEALLTYEAGKHVAASKGVYNDEWKGKAAQDPWVTKMKEYYKAVKANRLLEAKGGLSYSPLKIKSRDEKNIDALLDKLDSATTKEEVDQLKMRTWVALNGVYLKSTGHIKGKGWKAKAEESMDQAKRGKGFNDLKSVWEEEMRDHLTASRSVFAETNKEIREHNENLGKNPQVIPGIVAQAAKSMGLEPKPVEELPLGQWITPGSKNYEAIRSLDAKLGKEVDETFEKRIAEIPGTKEDLAKLPEKERKAEIDELKSKMKLNEALKDPEFLRLAYEAIHESHLAEAANSAKTAGKGPAVPPILRKPKGKANADAEVEPPPPPPI